MIHKQMAIEFFIKTWELLEKKDRTKDEDALMIHQAHASLYHWLQIGGLINFQRGEWLVSHVYSILKMHESALYHAKRCLDITLDNNIGDFDLTFSYEAMARSYSLVDNNKASEYLKLAYESIDKIKNYENKEYCTTQLDEIITSLGFD